MKPLHVGRGLDWPASLASQAIGVLGMRGAGKSNLGRVYAEELFAAGIPFVVFDPIGNWYGLRAGRDGRKGGGLPVPIFGGEHGDLPLDRSSGPKIADLVVDRRLSCVLDLSHEDFSEADKQVFLAAFGDRLFRRKKREDGWLSLILEEADDYAPQPRSGGGVKGPAAATLGVFQRLVRRGRFKGLGALMITQRSAAINKDLLYMVGTLVAFRTTGPRDQEAVEAWVRHNAASVRAEVMESLARLEDGEAWVIAQEALGTIQRVRFRQMATFDTGSTPEHGGAGNKPATLADIDLPQLSSELQAAVEKARADDPKELRRQVATLRAELAKRERSGTKAEVAPSVTRKIEVPVLKDAQIKRLEAAVARYEALSVRAHVVSVEIAERAREIKAALAAARDAPQGAAALRPAGSYRPAPVVRQAPKQPTDGLTGPEQKILDELARLEALGVTAPPKPQVSALCGYANPRSGGFSGPLGRLVANGLIRYPATGTMALTDEGRARANAPDTPLTTSALQERVLDKFAGPPARILRELIDAYPNALDKAALGQKLGYSNPRSGGFSGPLGTLSRLGFVEYPGPGLVKASGLLFLEGAA